MKCPRCGANGLLRYERHGFFQKKIYPLFGLYPWECYYCRKISLKRQRHEPKSAKSGRGEANSLWCKSNGEGNRPSGAEAQLILRNLRHD